jgi:hypothetical protein
LEFILKIDNLVVQIIKASNFDNFTTSDVRSAYIALSNGPVLDPVIIRRKLYAELLKLVNKGWLKKKSSNHKKGTRFSKTELFDAQKLIRHVTDSPNETTHYDDIKKSLTAKLNNYKAELLLNLGETEAYRELYDEFPELVTEIQSQYNEARDNNTKILGKIKAIESLIKQEKQQSA